MADLEEAPAAALPVITNVVATVDLGCVINLEQLFHSGYRYTEYTHKGFTGVVTLHLPGTSAIGRIFKTGKMTCMGSTTDDEAKLAARKFTRIVSERGFPDSKFRNFKVINVIAIWKLDFCIRLVGLMEELGDENCTYDELRPQVLYYKMKEPEITLNIFQVGKITLLGAKSDRDVFHACESIYQVLWEYRKKQ